jgi:hypothetical protein
LGRAVQALSNEEAGDVDNGTGRSDGDADGAERTGSLASATGLLDPDVELVAGDTGALAAASTLTIGLTSIAAGGFSAAGFSAVGLDAAAMEGVGLDDDGFAAGGAITFAAGIAGLAAGSGLAGASILGIVLAGGSGLAEGAGGRTGRAGSSDGAGLSVLAG